MKTKTILLLAIVFCFVGATAQDRSVQTIDPVRSYDGVVVFQKTNQVAKIFEFNYPAKDLENAIKGYFQNRGGKIGKSSGFNLVKGVFLHESENQSYDVYFKVSGKGSGAKAVSTLAVILADPGEDILLRARPEAGAPAVADEFSAFAGAAPEGFFGDLGVYVGEYDYGKSVTSYDQQLRKAERRYDDLVKKGRTLENRMLRLEREISDNLEAQRQQAREVERARLLLDQIKSKNRY